MPTSLGRQAGLQIRQHGVKQLNYLGRSVHAEDGGQAVRYNLDILYRRVRRQPVEGPTPAAG